MIQSLQNNNINNALRVGLSKIGFCGDGFEPVVTNSSISAAGTQSLTLLVGTVVFPNGEVFAGQRFQYTIPVEPSTNFQYLLINYQPLRQHEARYAPGFNPGNEYYMRRDGISWRLVDAPDFTYQGLNELMVAKIDLPVDGNMSVIDLRQMLYPYYGTDILAASEGILLPETKSFPVVLLAESISGRSVNNASMPCNREILTVLQHTWRSASIGELRRYYMQVRLNGLQHGETSIRTSRLPFSPTMGNFNIPVFSGTTYELAVRKMDRNKPTIYTEWLNEDNVIGGQVEDPRLLSGSAPSIGVEASTLSPSVKIIPYLSQSEFSSVPDEVIEHSYIQVWVKDGGRSTRIRPEIDPVTWEVPAILVSDTTEIPQLPKRCFYPSRAGHRMAIGARIVYPGHICSKIATAELQRDEEYVQYINFGLHYDGDSSTNSDASPGSPWSWNYFQHDHQRWCFSNGSTYYVAVFPCQITDGYLVKAEFENWYENAVADVGLLYIEGLGDVFNLPIECPGAGLAPYNSSWNGSVPIVSTSKLYFKLMENSSHPPKGDCIEVQGRLKLTFRTGSA